MTAPKEIIDLVQRFRRNLADYRSGKYNETQVRLEFIDPFFEALGWDVHNRKGYAEAYKDVVHEDQVKVSGATKAPDYGFRIGGVRKFFVEAKKPSIDIKDDVHPAYQLRRYAWSAKLPLSILTDFEELAVYDCRMRPVKSDKSGTARVMYFIFDEYVDKWDDLAAVFSREAVLQGSFDRYAESKKRKRGTAEVDASFLAEIERWRGTLARNIALRNPGLTVRDLNFAVQRTIDRVIFLRIAEDRGLEPYAQLRNLGEQKDTYRELCRRYLEADNRYNSGLFHFKTEAGRAGTPDEFTANLTIDDKVIQEILRCLYYPDSPYEFSVLPADILGQVYEQFLGKVIRLTAGGRAKVEDKPEVKKAGGVYYTPTYIVDYIVAQTVGALLEGKTPREAAKLSICDPACGSGSFLLGAYQVLLDWHRDYYVDDDPDKYARAAGRRIQALYQGAGGEWRLTTAEKRRILLNNIYGVDIDPQAVEVTKLSLLLKVLEGENEGSLGRQLAFFQERALPDLVSNIKCGNSLIGPDYYSQEGQQLALMDTEEVYRVNAFDWDAEFPGVFAVGGFDAVIGNPPYVRQELISEHKDYFKNHYAVYHGYADLYAYFIEKGIKLLKPGGCFSYIVANKWMRARYGELLRQLLKTQHIVEIIDFGDLPVFEKATTYPCIMVVANLPPSTQLRVTKVESLDFTELSNYVREHCYKVNQASLANNGWSLVDEKTEAIVSKIFACSISLKKYTNGRIYYGIKTGFNYAFIIDEDTKNELISRDTQSVKIIKLLFMGRDVKRYYSVESGRYLIFTRRGINIDDFPAVKDYLSQFKTRLTPKPKNWKGSRWEGRKAGSYKWYEIQDTVDYYKVFEGPKITVPTITKNAAYSFDINGIYSNDKTSVIASEDFYLLGLLNSKVCDFIMHMIASTKQDGYYEYKPMYLSQLPIRIIDFSNPTDAARHDKMVGLVETMLELHRSLAAARTPAEKQMLQRQIETTDGQIDALVYELYGLTEEEVRIVEGAG